MAKVMAHCVLQETIPEIQQCSHSTSDHDVTCHCASEPQPTGNGLTRSPMSSSGQDLDLSGHVRGNGQTEVKSCALKRHKSLTFSHRAPNDVEDLREIQEGRLKRSVSTPLDVPSNNSDDPTGVSSPAGLWNPFQAMCNIPNPEALRCKRLYIRRNALCDPEKMAMTQETRERVQRDVEHRKHSWRRKLTVYIRLKLGTDGEVDLF